MHIYLHGVFDCPITVYIVFGLLCPIFMAKMKMLRFCTDEVAGHCFPGIRFGMSGVSLGASVAPFPGIRVALRFR